MDIVSPQDVEPDSPPEPLSGRFRSGLLGAVRLPVVVAFVLSFALLLLHAPYRGVRHDGQLYAGQAVHLIDPSWSTHDLFFKYGSQDQFTFFTNIYAWFIQVFDLGSVSIGLLLAAHLLFLLAAFWLTSDLPRPARWLSLVFLGALMQYFGSGRMFSFLEPFLTARSFAEPAAVLALAALIRGRFALAIAALAAAMLMHPLVAIPTAVAGWFYLVARDRRWLWAGMALLPIAALAGLGVEPFDRLRHQFDEAWLATVTVVTPDVFVSLWSGGDFVDAFGTAGLLWLAARRVDGALAVLARASVLAAIALCLVSFVGADLLHNVLITQLQLWRSLWVVRLLFVLCMPTLVLWYWPRGSLGRLVALNLALMTVMLSDQLSFVWALALWMLAVLGLYARNVQLSRTMVRLLAVASVLIAIVVSVQIVWSLASQNATDSRGTPLTYAWSIPFCLGVLTIPAAAGLVAASTRSWTAWAAVVAILVAAGLQFDQRSPWSRYVEDAGGHHPFQALIPPDAQVYWEDADVEPTWLMLHRSAYLGGNQLAGLVFSRGAAAATRERWPQLVPIFRVIQNCSNLQSLIEDPTFHFADCVLPEKDFLNICRGDKQHADFLVTHIPYAHQPIARWVFDPRDGQPPVTYFLHDCRSVRAMSPLPETPLPAGH